jgi:uncharacterized protein (TIGR03032 family)
MRTDTLPLAESPWAQDDVAWRSPEEVIAGRREIGPVSRRRFDIQVSGDWWQTLDSLDACVVVSREYEHLLLALTVAPDGPRQSFMPVPHPSGMAFNARTERLHIASTRNPNQLYVLGPAGSTNATGEPSDHEYGPPLVPLSVSFLPGRLYLHDLALIKGALYGNAAGLNAVVRLISPTGYEVVWWPRSIERDGHPDMTRNYLQLNSIAAGEDLGSSFFSASTSKPSHRRPGHRNFPVDKRGVIFSGATREPVARGLTRPHSARLYRNELWVNDSGYGRLALIRDGLPTTVARLPGWTRGLTFAGDVAFVGTSRVIPRFAQYAPGLDLAHSICGVHALDIRSGEVLGSICWPTGNQVFDIKVLSRRTTRGFPAVASRRQSSRALEAFFFSYQTPNLQEHHDC